MIIFFIWQHIVLLAELLLSLPLLFSVRFQSIAILFPVEKPFIPRPNASRVLGNLPVVLGGRTLLPPWAISGGSSGCCGGP